MPCLQVGNNTSPLFFLHAAQQWKGDSYRNDAGVKNEIWKTRWKGLSTARSPHAVVEGASKLGQLSLELDVNGEIKVPLKREWNIYNIAVTVIQKNLIEFSFISSLYNYLISQFRNVIMNWVLICSKMSKKIKLIKI